MDFSLCKYPIKIIKNKKDFPSLVDGIFYTFVDINVDGIRIEKESFFFLKNGVFHRDDGPAFVHAEFEEYYKDGINHREQGPAFVKNDEFYLDLVNLLVVPKNTPFVQRFYIDGARHNIKGPSEIVKDENGNFYESYFLDGKLKGKSLFKEDPRVIVYERQQSLKKKIANL